MNINILLPLFTHRLSHPFGTANYKRKLEQNLASGNQNR
jgi:hypothetical protein